MRSLAILLITIAATTACPYYIEHSPELAVEIAEEFSQQAFVDRNLHAAYKKLTEQKAESFTEPAFMEFVGSMHPEGNYPKSIEAIGYEIVPGQEIINVYLQGDILEKPTYYRLELRGDSRKSYTVTGMYRRDAPYKTSNLYRSL